MTITIKTLLDSGIYKSSGGGQTTIHYEFATGPRNLLRAIETLRAHRDEMGRCYGNIGCGASWMEIDGQRVDSMGLTDVMRDDAEAFGADAPAGMIKSRTKKASELIEAVRSSAANNA